MLAGPRWGGVRRTIFSAPPPASRLRRCRPSPAGRRVSRSEVERTGSDLRAPRDLAHAGIGAATSEDLLRDFQDALAIALGVRARLAGGFWGGRCFHGTF